MRSLLGRFHRPMSRGLVNNMLTMNNLGDGSTLSLDFTTMGGVLDPRLTFSRASGGTYVWSDGYIYGVDSATSASLAIGTGSKSVTLTATANVDRRFQVGQTVYFSSGANNMNGLVTAYNASTQVITINATATTGSGSFTSWFVGNASPRFDYSPTNIGEPRGLLIEGSGTTINNYGEAFDNAAWTASQIDKTGMTTSQTDPANGTNARILKADANAGRHALYQITGTNPGTGTLTVWAKAKELGFATLQLANAFESKSVVVTFDLATGATSGVVANSMTHVASDAVQFKDGWWRLRLTATLTVGAVPDDRMLPWIGLANASGSAGRSFTASGSGIYIYGAQLEAGSGASSYIPTGASTVTRTGDYLLSASSSGASRTTEFSLNDLAPGISALNEHTVLWTYGRDPNNKREYPATVYARTNANTVRIDMRDFTGTTVMASTQTRTVQTVTVGTASKVKIALAQNTSAYPISAINGTSATLTSGVIDSALGLQWVQLGNTSVVAASFNPIWAQQLKLYPTQLTAAQLQTLTAP